MVRTGLTVTDACDDYLPLARDRPRPQADDASRLSVGHSHHIVPAFGTLRVEDLTAEHVEAFKAGLEMSNRTKIKVLTILHGIMKRAGRIHRLPHNVVRDVEKPRQRRRPGDIDVFTPEEVLALVALPIPNRTRPSI